MNLEKGRVCYSSSTPYNQHNFVNQVRSDFAKGFSSRSSKDQLRTLIIFEGLVLRNFRIFVSCICLAVSPIANAWTECQVTIDRIFVDGNNGAVFIYYTNGGGVSFAAETSFLENALSVAMAAHMASREVRIRYNGDNVSCTAIAVPDFAGITIL